MVGDEGDGDGDGDGDCGALTATSAGRMAVSTPSSAARTLSYVADEPPVIGSAVGRDATPAAHASMPMAGSMTDLPSGAVTFLFSDIEGSTRLVKALREQYAQVLAEHRRLVRTAIASQAGHEVDTQGDAFFVAFASAKQAVLCALQVQRALVGHEWPSGVSVRVRMGIHTGQATPVEGAYTGLAVHRAARICAAARGGQVLVSQATQTLIEDEEEEELGFALVELGERRLKDLDRPVRLFELTVAEAAQEPPPQPITPASVLPSIVGRTAELRIMSAAYARAMAGQSQVMLITGEAGIGKTRLVEELTGGVRSAADGARVKVGESAPMAG